MFMWDEISNRHTTLLRAFSFHFLSCCFRWLLALLVTKFVIKVLRKLLRLKDSLQTLYFGQSISLLQGNLKS